MLEAIRRTLIVIAFDIPLGKFNPWILGLALGGWPRKVPDRTEDEAEDSWPCN
jgi:hypothetical protein